MSMILRRPIFVLGTTILLMQAVFMPIGMVYTETTTDTETQEHVELPPLTSYLEEQESEPRFNFTESRIEGTVEEPVKVVFFSDQEVSEVRVTLPEEAQVLTEQLPVGISVEQDKSSKEWVIQAQRAQNTFVLPLVFDIIGNYELSISMETLGIEIGNKNIRDSFDQKPNSFAHNSKMDTSNLFDYINAEEFARSLIHQNSPISITNAAFTGNSRAIGKFSGGESDTSFSNGVILSTGDIGTLGTTMSKSTDLGSAGSSMLSRLASDFFSQMGIGNLRSPSFDAITVAFDFQLLAETPLPVSFDYRFISAEHFQSIEYNDVFGFFIDGQNVALVNMIHEGKTIDVPVTAFSINSDMNEHLFNDIIGKPTIFDPGGSFTGMTDTLTTNSFIAEPNRVYRVELSLADIGDPMLDSIVVLPEGGFYIAGESVIVYHQDKLGNMLSEPELITGSYGEEYSTSAQNFEGYLLIKTPDNASGTIKEFEQVVTYVYDVENVSPVDPLAPEVEVDPENKPELPENQGQLSIDFISSFNFGSQTISAKEKTYSAQPQRLLNEDGTVSDEVRPNYVQVSDRRSENERGGWQLAITQREQFTADGEELSGARLRLTNQELVTNQGGTAPSFQETKPLTLVPGIKQTLVRAERAEGTGTWIYRFGNQESADKSVLLDIPAMTNPDAISYSTTLVWELSSIPGN